MSKNNKIDNGNEEKIMVNGPVNVFRLEGKIGNVNKTVYLFGDFHHSICAETKCDSFDSKDFVNYFYNEMKNIQKNNNNTNITYDFLYENFVNVDMFSQKDKTRFSYRENYIDELRKYIVRDMDLQEKKDKENIIYENKGSKSFDNLRLHYLDIRSFFDFDLILNISNNISNLFESLERQPNINIINIIMTNFYKMKYNLEFIINKLQNKKQNKTSLYIDNETIKIEVQKYVDNFSYSENRIKKYSDKIFKKYKHKDVKEKLLKSELLSEILKFLNKIIKILDYCIEKSKKIEKIVDVGEFELAKKISGYTYGIDNMKFKKIFYKIKIKCELIDNYMWNAYANLTDLYLLRRLLDKDFITNGIVYTGMYHTSNYLYYLVNDFDFKVTHADYSKVSINELNKIIKNNKKNEVEGYIYKPIFKQCSDMSKFPKNFL